MNEDKTGKGRRIIIIVLAVFWGLVTLFGVGYYIYTFGKVPVIVKFAPYVSTVKFNDVIVNNNGKNYIKPGSYHVVVEFENFASLERDVIVDESTEYIYGGLTPINDDGEKYMEEHIDDYYEVQGLAGDDSLKAGMRELEEYPIIGELPIRDPYYTIGYNYAEDGTLNVTVESGIAYRQLAVSKLMDIMSKDDIGKYNVLFYNIDNPYSGVFVDNDEREPDKFLMAGFANAGVDFTVGGGTRENEYYYAYLRYYYQKYAGVVYRVVLKWEDEGWKLMGDPYPVLTSTNTPDVPVEILYKANRL